MWDSGLHAMPNKWLKGGLLLTIVGISATAYAQIVVESESDNAAPDTTEVAPASDTDAAEKRTGDEPSGLSSTIPDDTLANDADKAPTVFSSQGDDYKPSERVSEDRSISFPVDI